MPLVGVLCQKYTSGMVGEGVYGDTIDLNGVPREVVGGV